MSQKILITADNTDEDKRVITRKKVGPCIYFICGFCKFGKNCFYTHEEKHETNDKVWNVCSNPECVIERKKTKI